ncbi:MAG: phage tail assembly protein [Candidatus Cloacimonetes bacterium]|nr:phage tail assembly protein [Candidatus Cloacimonadota bacterium]
MSEETNAVDVTEQLMSIDLSEIKKYKLKKPINIAGTDYTELTVDFDSIKGSQLKAMSRRGGLVSQDAPFYELSKSYQELVVSLATNTPVNVIMELYSADWTALTVRAQVFLLGAASEGIAL